MQRPLYSFRKGHLGHMVHRHLQCRPSPTPRHDRRSPLLQPRHIQIRKGHDAQSLPTQPQLDGCHHGQLCKVRVFFILLPMSRHNMLLLNPDSDGFLFFFCAVNWQNSTATTSHQRSSPASDPTCNSTQCQPCPTLPPRLSITAEANTIPSPPRRQKGTNYRGTSRPE